MTNRKKGGGKRNDGKRHENKVDAAIKRLYPQSRVETNVFLPGIISGGKRQVDTLLHSVVGMTDFEAKDYSRNVGIDTIANYAFKLKDEQVAHGVMVSNSPYAPTAIKTAEHFDVKLTHLIDTDDKESNFQIAQKTIVEDTVMRRLRMRIRDTGFEPISVPYNLEEVTLVDASNEGLSAYSVFRNFWNTDACSAEEGQHDIVLANQKVVTTDGRVVMVTEFIFDYVVETIYRLGEWPLEQTMGLYDVSEGSLMTRNVTSSSLSTDEMNKWQQISREEMENVTYGVKLVVKSMLPDELPSTRGNNVGS